MRAGRPLSVLPALLLLTAVASGCSGDPAGSAEQQPTAASSAANGEESSQPSGSAGATGGAGGTFDGVADPATKRVPLEQLSGFADVRVWPGSTISEGTRMVSAELRSPEGSLLVGIDSTSPAIVKEDSRAELAYWMEYSNLVEGRPKEVDPVVVDGLEMLHARGQGPFGVVDYFVHGTGSATWSLTFALPDGLGEQEREDRIAQVMATVDFD